MIDPIRATPLSVMAVLVMTLLPVGAARADGDPVRGEARFQECAACHKLDSGSNGIGPSLHGVFERKAGALADFRYSPALKRSGIVWSPQTLEAYLADPQAVVPGNRMPYAGMANPADRADLIAYLATASR
jgi:cytochrome c